MARFEEMLQKFDFVIGNKRILDVLHIVAGIMLRPDTLGVTSIVRALGLKPKCYSSLIGLFHSKEFEIDKAKKTWAKVLADSGLVCKVEKRALLCGDGVTSTKEGKRMPSVNWMFQKSESMTKKAYFHAINRGSATMF
jgi:hypothetical protein